MAEPWRSIKRTARRVVHSTMQVPAIAIDSLAAEHSVTVRVHDKQGVSGDLAGTNLNYAEVRERQPSLIFWRYQFEPVRGMVVSVETGEAYRVDHLEPPDDTTIRALVTPLTNAETIGLPLPDAAGSVNYPLPETWYPNSPSAVIVADEFLPIPELLDEDATYFYMGWSDVDGSWLIRRKERSTTSYLDAAIANNSGYADLAAAWPDRATLAYA